jgi:chorismate mutase
MTASLSDQRHSDPGAPANPMSTSRDRIDALDRRIVDLILRRAQLSEAVQNARLAGGGPRRDLARENHIIARYTASLGTPGCDIALGMLRLCRGLD